ncbi:MAG: AraC family transcriptional regulator [Bryobacteraceae bacterium]
MIAQENPGNRPTAWTARLASVVERIAATPGDHRTALPALTLHRRNRPSQPVHCIYTLGLAVTVQGTKRVLLGERQHVYGPGQSLLTTIDLPVSYHVTHASAAEPFLGIMLKLERSLIIQAASGFDGGPPAKAPGSPLSLQRLNAPVLDALHRMINLLDEPSLLPQLAPLIEQEIVVRLLAGPHGPHLRNLANATSPERRIDQTVGWLREHFAEQTRVGDLAERANMSETTFRHHFRTITGMSPLQFQKLLRLQEARQLMLERNMSAGTASALVGYESVSQFSREYRRLFGAPPLTDIRKALSH